MKGKKFISGILFLLLLSFAMPVELVNAMEDEVPDGDTELIISEFENYGEGFYLPMLRAVGYLNAGRSTILGTGAKVTYKGTTYSTSSMTVKVTAQVQRYSGGSWSNVSGASVTASKSSTTEVSASSSATVSKGYYYRTKSTHSATKGSTTETGSSSSSSIWVN